MYYYVLLFNIVKICDLPKQENFFFSSWKALKAAS